ncbi:MAG: cyclase family protein, partial [Chloroflexota bacterium]
MGRPRLIDLTMEIYQGMPTYPSVAKPFVHELENHQQMAQSTGAWQYGLTHAPNHCVIVSGDHIGTHLDSWGHVKPDAPRAEGIPLEYCYGPGVVLDLSHIGPGRTIGVDDAAKALAATGYDLQPLDIVRARRVGAQHQRAAQRTVRARRHQLRSVPVAERARRGDAGLDGHRRQRRMRRQRAHDAAAFPGE